jgi:glycosyltransferase involved in cell wall biosynthesis
MLMPDKMNPEITVLLPAYNVGEYVKEAVDSVLAQSFTNFELLILNDGSTDNTLEILNTYTDPRIRIVSHPNMGLVKTLNKGMELAQCKWIARFDADDVCYPERLAVQYEFLQNNPDYILVGSDADYMDEQGNYIFTFENKYYEDDEIKSSGFVECPFVHASVLFLKDAVIKAGRYDENAITFEDHLLWRKLSDYGKLKNFRKPLIKVRFNPGSVTIDEKWRGKEFIELKQRSIQSGKVQPADSERIKEILKSQNFASYKKAAYHSMLGKKFLWNQHNPRHARQHLRKAISAHPGKAEPYLLYLFSFFPSPVIDYIYNFVKK